MKATQVVGPVMQFRAHGGPHDGDILNMPLSAIPTSKSMVLQDKKAPLGHLSKYFFNKLTQVAIFQGAVQVKADGSN